MTTDRIVHSNFRKGLNDYNDGADVVHYLGNDEYDGSNLDKAQKKPNPKLDGKVAEGNSGLEEIEPDNNAKE